MYGCFTDINRNQVCSTSNVEKAMFDIYDFDRLVNEFTYNNQNSINVNALDNGNFVFSYESIGEKSSNNDVYFKILDKNKNIIKSETCMNTGVGSEEIDPKIIVFRNNYFIYAFKLNYCGRYTIFADKFNYSGTRISSGETELTLCNQTNYTNYGTVNGYLIQKYFEDKLIVIREQTGASNDINSDCYFKIFNVDFSLIKDITKVSVNNNGNQTQPCSAIVENPTLITHRIVMLWTTNLNTDSTGLNINAIIYNSDYSIAKDEFRVNTYSTNDQINSKIVYLKNTEGKFLIVYTSHLIANNQYEVAAQIFDYNGNKISNEVIVNNYRNLGQHVYAVFATQNNIYVSWDGTTPQDKNDSGIGVTKLDYNLNVINEYYPNKLDIGWQGYPNLAVSSTGQVAVAWGSYQGDGRGYSLHFEYLEVCPDEYFADPNDNYICKPCEFSCDLGCSQF